jgi:hypothetical protein
MAGKVQGDKDFRTLPARILIFCNNLFFMLEINSKKWMKKNKNCIFWNLTMGVPLLHFNLFLVNKCSSKCMYIEL